MGSSGRCNVAVRWVTRIGGIMVRRNLKIAAAFASIWAAAWLAAAPASAHPVLMISIDGLRPADVLDAQKLGIVLPHMNEFLEKVSHATAVRNALPTVTYPNHTTLITGVWPSLHGIAANATFDPLRKNMGGYYWYYNDIKVPTLWSA